MELVLSWNLAWSQYYLFVNAKNRFEIGTGSEPALEQCWWKRVLEIQLNLVSSFPENISYGEIACAPLCYIFRFIY